MSLKKTLIGLATRAGLEVFRALVLYLPDKFLGKLFRAVERLVYVLTGDPDVTASVAEVADIFETGPPFTTTIRKMLKAAEPELIVSSVQGLTRESPYGAA